MNTTPILVSIIICTYNRKKDLLQCLDSIRSLHARDLEIIIVDNHSADDTVNTVKQQYPEAIIICNPANFGTAYAKNQGIKRARGEYIWFLDSDTVILSKDVLSNMLNYFKLHPQTGALGGQIFEEDNILKYWVMGERTDRKIPVTEPGVHEYSLHFLATCSCMVKREVLRKLGGFDLHYFYYCEDLDLGLRIGNLGLTNVFRSDCCVFHKFSQKERTGEYYLFYRNLLRSLIMNRTVWYIIGFPFTQMLRVSRDFIQFRKQGQRMENIKTVNETKKQKKYVGRLGIAKLGLTILGALIQACAWNLARFPRTIYLKYKKPNYLDQVHEFN